MNLEEFLARLDGVREMAPGDAERFWSKVDRRGPDECWPWKASVNVRNRYGQFAVSRPKKTMLRAHRVAYELAKGPIPEGLLVRHTCDNRPCCNPAHLIVGTDLDNVRDMDSRGRRVVVLPPPHHGEDNPQSKLTNAQRAEIVELRMAGESAESLALRFGVNRRTVNRTIRRAA